MRKLLEAVENKWLDPIALDHSIRRYCINNFSLNLVWDYPGIDKSISLDDQFIRELNGNFSEVTSEVMEIVNLMKIFPDSDAFTNEKGQ